MFANLAAGAVSEVSTVTNDANWFLENAWIIALLPAISFVLILFFGKRMPKNRICLLYTSDAADE